MPETTELTGVLYDIQSFSVQDGPGVRTTAFLKGCPLRCPWCHSPESQEFFPQLSWMSMRCQGTEACKSRCIEACPKGAIALGETRKDAQTGAELQMVHVDRTLCDNCGACTAKCYPGALTLCGETWTVPDLVKRLERDRMFYRDDGGVTISGGECLCQPEFTIEVARRLKADGIHICIDTTGDVKWEIVERIMPYTDIFLYDLKHMDSAKHRQVIGVPNELILENARKIAAAGGKMHIRIPIIPRFNEDDENLRATAEFCRELGGAVLLIQLLPYHNLGVSKYLRISDKKVLEAIPPSDEKMQHIKELFTGYGLKATIH